MMENEVNEELTTTNKELQARNELLNESYECSEAIIATIHEPMIVLDKDLRVKSANKAFYRKFKVTEEATEGMLLYDLGNGQWNIPALRKSLEDIIPKNSYFHDYEVINNFPGIGEKIMLLNAGLIIQKATREQLILLAIHDVTEQITAQKEIEATEKQYRDFINGLPIGIYTCDADGNIELYNDAAIGLWGRIPVRGKDKWCGSWKMYNTDGTLLPHDECPMAVAVKEGHVVNREVIIERPDGIKFTVIPYPQPLRDPNGKITGAINTVINVTHQVDARKKIEESEQRYNHLIYSSPFAIGILYGEDLIITIANEAIIEIWGKGKEIIGKAYFEALPELAEQGYQEVFANVYKTGIPFNAVETPVNILQNGVMQLKYYNFLLYPQRNVSGKIVGIGIIATEVTSQALLNKQIQENEKQLRELSLSLEEKVNARTTELREINEALKLSEEKFNKLFTSSPLGLTLSEIPSGKFTDVNQTYLQMAGFTKEEYLGHTSLELNLVDKSDYDKILTELQQHGFARNMEIAIRRKTGEKIPVLNSIETISIGNKKYFLSAIIDITQRKKTENKLRQSEERYHRMIEEVQDYAIILLSKDGIIENWNKGAEKIKGYKAEEIVGKNFSVFYTPEDQVNRIPEKMLSIAREKGKAIDENWRVRKDGSRFWSSIVITALHDNQKNIIGFVKVTRDLTARKFAEEEIKAKAQQLESNNIQLEKMNKELQSFAYISSHDLQEPLRKIQTFSSRILEKEVNNLSENGKDNFKRMQAAAQRMQTLIDDLLAYSRTSTAEREFETTDLNKIIDEVREDLREDLKEKHATIEATELCAVNVIPFQFRQLMHNIIGNALKFSNPETEPHIKIKSEIAAGNKFNNEKLSPQKIYCHISITDNGIGFEQQYSEKIFELFQRLHGKSEYKGTGIGLSIVKKIVDNHAGIITATSDVNKGATFDIYFPA